MPAAATAAAAGGAAAAGTPPQGPDDPTLEGEDDETPWWKTPAGIAVIVLIVIALLGLLAWLIWGGDDDDDGASSTSSALVLQARDLNGDPLDVGFLVDVRGPALAETSYNWVRPSATPGDTAGANTGSSGRVVFEWEPDATISEEDYEGWTSTASGVANVPAGWTPPGPVVECVLDPLEGQESVVSMNIELESADDTVDRTAAFTFPNFTFSLGDTLRCQLDAIAPAATTAPATSTPATSTPTTSAPGTTAPGTTAPGTTAPGTTAPGTTTPDTSAPPVVPATAYEALDAAGNFTEFLAAVDQAPTVKDLLESSGPITVFAPNDDAFSGVTPPSDPDDLEQLLLSHVVDGEALDAAAVAASSEVDVASGGTQPVDASGDPVTVGGAGIVSTDIESENGLSHELDAIMPSVAP
jgi:uncharacterized surface protein with fasciclin (FAS1) repeats